MGEKTRSRLMLLSLGVLAIGAIPRVSSAQLTDANKIIAPGDPIIAIDNNRNLPGTFNTAGTETPAMVLDQNPATKYLNFGREMTGIIVQPASGASVLKSFTLTTANDGPERDPASYFLYGTNSAIVSADNSAGTAEPWTLVQTGLLNLSQTRQQLQPPVDVTNTNSYGAYKLVFQKLKMVNAANTPANPNSMQIGDIQFFPNAGGAGTGILAVGDTIRGIDETDSAYPPTERPLEAIDGLKDASSKYLNFGREGTGLIITPSKGATVAKALQLTTANDTPSRDPSHYELYGTNSSILSTEHSLGNAEPWTLISSGDITLPDARNVDGDLITFAGNNGAFTSYKIIFTENKGPDTGTGSANSIQFSEVVLFDAIPEPATAGLALGAAMMGLVARRRNA